MSKGTEPWPEVYAPRSASATGFPRPESRPGATEPVWPPEPYAATAHRHASDGDRELARPLQESPDDGPGEPQARSLVPLDNPRVRGRIFERLADPILFHAPDVLIPAGDDPAGIATVLADRTGLPLLPVAPAPTGAGADLDGRRAAIVGETIRATSVADLVRSLEQGRASVVAIVGVAASDGDEMVMLSNHYNVFYIIPLD